MKERNFNVWLPLARPLLGTWPATQASALTGNRTSSPLVSRPALNSLSHTSRFKLCIKQIFKSSSDNLIIIICLILISYKVKTKVFSSSSSTITGFLLHYLQWSLHFKMWTDGKCLEHRDTCDKRDIVE